MCRRAMKKLFAFLCAILYSKAGEFQIINKDVGPYSIHVNINNVPNKYHPLTLDDTVASNNALMLAKEIGRVPLQFGIAIDPFEKKELEPVVIGQPEDWINGKIILRNLHLAGAKDHKLNSLTLRLDNFRTDFNLSIPELLINVDFEVKIFFGMLPLLFNTHLKAILHDVKLAGAIGAKKKSIGAKQVLQLVSADVNLNAKDVWIEVSNFDIGNSIDEMLSSSNWIDDTKQQIAQDAIKAVINQTNKLLSYVTVEQVLGFLLEKP